MSTEQYPEVTGDESGIVPPQSTTTSSPTATTTATNTTTTIIPNRTPEWPKKLRTLTASELDRLTIDGSGRFYWDGKLVNYETTPKPKDAKISDSLNRSLDILEQAANELGPRRTPPPIEGAELPKPGEAGHHENAIDLDFAKLEAAVIQPHLDGSALPIRSADSIRVTLTKWQKVGVVVVVIGIAIGAVGVAAYGLAAAHEWGCRNGMLHGVCGMPGARSPRSDIPA